MNKVTTRGIACLVLFPKCLRRLCTCLAIGGVAFLSITCLWLPVTNAQHSDQPPIQTSAEINTPALLDLLGQTYLTLESHHYAPPTGQQFALTAARVIRDQSGRTIDRAMKSEVEELMTADDLRKWLTKEIEIAKQNYRELNADAIVNVTVKQFDPRATVISSKEARVRDQLRENRYVGIGIRVRYDNGFAIIDEPFPGGAAKIAGAKPGDIILEVNDKSMEGLDLRQIVDVLRGDVDTAVSVVVRNEKETGSRRLDMIRTVIPIPSVEGVSQNDDGSWEFVDAKKSTPAQLKVTGIVGSTASELADAARKVRSAGVTNILLDMREVVDADLHHAQIVADTLTGAGLFATVTDGNGKQQKLNTRDECEFEGLRVAVLVPEKVSGPVMAVLCRLNSNPNMTTVGTVVVSDLSVSSSFEFPDGSGSISGVSFSRIDAASLNLKDRADVGPTNMSGDLVGVPGAVLTPATHVNNSAEAPATALRWLNQNDK